MKKIGRAVLAGVLAFALSAISASANARARSAGVKDPIMTGETATGRLQAVLVAEDGTIAVDSSSGAAPSTVVLADGVTILVNVLAADAATATNQTSGNTSVDRIDQGITILTGTVSGSEQQVDVVTSGLPSGASTGANQTAGNTSLDRIDQGVTILSGAVSGSEVQVDVVTSALPSGAATSTLQTTGNTSADRIDQGVTILSGAVSGSEVQVDVVTSALPSGASTAANQATANTSLDRLDQGVTNVLTDTTAIELNTDTGTLIDHAAVVVGNSATLIAAADATRRSITISNGFTNLVAIGNSDVTLNTADATDGFVLASGSPAENGKGGTLTLNTTAAVYGIGASASSKVNYIVETD